MNVELDIDDATSDDEVTGNFFDDFVTFSRSKQVLNEKQAMVVQLVLASGYLDDWRDYNSAIVTGSSSSGKSHMLREVTTESLEYAEAASDDTFLYELTGGSDKAAIDDDELDEAFAAYLHELNKIPDEIREFVKSVSEDGGFTYGRNIPDDTSVTGRSTVHIDKEPIPVLFAFADENEDASGDDQELRSRLVEVKVAENQEKNEAVHHQKWGERHISLPSARGEYIFDADDVAHRVKAHMRDVPHGVNVVLPTADGRFPSDDWHAGEVTAPMFNFKRSESTRASAYLASLVKASAVLNHHERDVWCEDCGEVAGPREAVAVDYECPCGGRLLLIAEPQDVGHIIACRDVLLATTHNLTSKKFAIIDAIVENGSVAASFDNVTDAAVMATKTQVEDYIQSATDIATMSKHEISKLLDELNEQLIIQKRDHPDDGRKNVYVFDGAALFESPRATEYYDRFRDVYDPVSGDDIEVVIDRHLEAFNASLETDVASLSASAAMGGGSIDDWDSSDLSDDAERVADKIADAVGGGVVPNDDVDDMEIEHMVGVTPITESSGIVRPDREPSGADKVEGFMSLDEWDEDTFDAVESRIVDAVTELQEAGVFEMNERDDGVRLEINR